GPRTGGARSAIERLRTAGARDGSGDQPVLFDALWRDISPDSEISGDRKGSASAVSLDRHARGRHGGSALEFPQISDRPPRRAGGRVSVESGAGKQAVG